MKADTAIHNIMTRVLVTVRPEDTTATVFDIFRRHDFHHLPVVDTSGALKGIISKTDLYKFTEQLIGETTGKTFSEKVIKGTTAAEMMTPDPMILEPEDSIGLAADIFLVNRFHALPVVEDGTIVGLITTHDLLAYAYQTAWFQS